MSLSVNKSYKIVSRWMHKTLTDWQIVLKANGADVLIYEEYVDFTTNVNHFKLFILMLTKHCPNLTHVRLLFSGESSDCFDGEFVRSLLQLPNLICLSLFDAPAAEIYALRTGCNQLTTLKLVGFDENVSVGDFSNIFGSMKNLQNVIYEYKSFRDNQIVAALSNASKLKSLTLYYAPESELKQLKNCNQLEILHLYNIDVRLGPEDFLEIFKAKRDLHTLTLCFIDGTLCKQLSQLDAFCPKLTCLTINQQLGNLCDFVNLKYLRFESSLPIFETKELVDSLSQRYADRLEILDISMASGHTHTLEITKLKSLRAFLCSSWPSNMYPCLAKLEHLQFFAFETYSGNVDDSDELIKMIINCKHLGYLRLPYRAELFEEPFINLSHCLSRSRIRRDSPFVLSVCSGSAVVDIEKKLTKHTQSNLLQLDWNGKVFAAKLKDLIASLCRTETCADDQRIYKNPVKAVGDPSAPEDSWLSNMNYKLALAACSKRFNLDYDLELVNRCRDFAISNAEYELTNMQFAFNFKYDAIDEQNAYPQEHLNT